MAKNPSDSNVSRPGAMQSMLARLRGLVQAVEAPQEPADERALNWDNADLSQGSGSAVTATASRVSPITECPLCKYPRKNASPYCEDCGFTFPPDAVGTKTATASPAPTARIKGRYTLGESLGERCGIARFRGFDHGANGSTTPVPVMILRAPATQGEQQPAMAETPPPNDEFMPTFDDDAEAAPVAVMLPSGPTTWPSIGWERELLNRVDHPAFPAWLDNFVEGNFEYLIEEVPVGQSLWDAWDAEDATVPKRYDLLKQVAEALRKLHSSGAMLEAIRPALVTVSPDGRARINDLSELLPLPLPPDPPVRGTLYTAPELITCNNVSARASLYSFGGMIFALQEGRELDEKNDFERPGSPKPILAKYPDIHPLLFRLLTKTFVRDLSYRFPSDEAAKEDPSGFTELIRVLDQCGRTLDLARLDIASWTTTGIVRTGNEDAFALIHSVESRQDDLRDSALIFVADGMGGYEAGEVAAAMCMQILRKNLLALKPFSTAGGQSAFPADPKAPGSANQEPLDIETCKKHIMTALKDANKQIYAASRAGGGRRIMGCTAEVVYVDGRNVVVGHVGDSRTYHLSQGRLKQLTRDQTLVNRLVELGTLTPEEAVDHPRKNELQQAVGGQPDVEPGLYHATLKQGDWIVVCSDGLTGHVSDAMLREMLQLEAASAEMAARRLTNLVNVNGATDNSTVVVIRAT